MKSNKKVMKFGLLMGVYASVWTLVIVFAVLCMMYQTNTFGVPFMLSIVVYILLMGPTAQMESEISKLMNEFDKEERAINGNTGWFID